MIDFFKITARNILLRNSAMQQTRRYILEIVKERRQATVDEIVTELRRRMGKITAVTVRHHLSVLQRDDLITAPQLLHRSTPGRPQHVYTLTERAKDVFPNNYQPLATRLLEQIAASLPPAQVNVILEGVADRMASDARVPNAPLPNRLDTAVDYLNAHGYNASWEKCDGGYMLHTANCPYHHVAVTTESLCEMDMRLVASLLGVVPRLVARVSAGASTCSYMIPARE